MANIHVYSCSALSGTQVQLDRLRMTGDTVLNPSVGFCLQMVAAIREGDVLILFRDVWPLLVPSIIGAIVGGYFMKGIYEPLLLYIKYKDLAEETDSALLREE